MRLPITHPRPRRRRPADRRRPGERPVGRLHAEHQDALQDRPHRAATSWTARGCSSSTTTRAARSCESGTAGWKQVAVPNAWNVGDDSDAVVPRRRRLVPQGLPLPDRLQAARRGSCASSRSTTARRSGSTASRSARTAAPTCRSRSACRPGCSSAAASTTSSSASTRAASRPTSRPPGLSIVGKPTGGWWNYGGLLREVYLRKINDVDFNTVVVRPDLPCATCAGDGHLPRHAAQLRLERPARRRQRALRRARARHRHGRRSAPSASPR